ncbi:MAG: 50S ribosomal protein L6 [Planctomycetota bacterium]|nr:MAG: 50S ribosomal protein L6 [Planctomycetota bacterium]
MSRIGKKAVSLPAGVSLTVAADHVQIKGPKGELQFPLFPEVTVEQEENAAVVKQTGGGGRKARALHGLVRAHLANMVEGVTQGFSASLEIVGTGWNAKAAGKGIEMQIGFCHPVKMDAPDGIQIEVPNPTEIVVRGIDKQKVGQFAANIRRVRPPEPYKGKGIRYKGEIVRRKVGKSVS